MMKRLITALLAALIVISMFSAQAVVPGLQTTTTKPPSSSAKNSSAGANGFSIVGIDWDTAILGQYACPNGYTATRIIDNCSANTTLGHPIRVSVILSSKTDDARMQYYCGEDYLERVYSSTSLLSHKEGEVDVTTMTFMRRYQNAAEYCDALAQSWAPGAVFWKSEDVSACDARLSSEKKRIETEVVPGFAAYGMYTDWIETTAAERVYTYVRDGKKYCICVMAEVYALQYSSNANGVALTSINWEVPCYYILWCPYESYERIHGNAFAAFVQNTSINDEMEALNEKLTEEIGAKVIRECNMMCAASSAYMASMTALTFSMVESSMSYSYTGSYSSDRFSDYMFDENDYTLSDGRSVKVSTSYSYVWEGSNGTVYYGNSLSDAPGGATQLYPNR